MRPGAAFRRPQQNRRARAAAAREGTGDTTMQIQPYLFFDGRCEEARAFYKSALGAQVDMLMRFKDAPPQSGEMGSCQPNIAPQKVMHASFRVGGAVKNNRFVGERGPIDFEGLFGDKQSLVVYTYMYGPQRERPCPMCTSLLSAWDGEANDIMQRAALAVIARSPIERLVAFKKERGWRVLKFYSDPSQDFSRDFHAVGEKGEDWAGLHVFTRRDGTIRHFWSGEMDFSTADPGQAPRGAPDLLPLWTVLDPPPEGREPHWYPQLDYGG